jgi:hypothetical protein
VTRLSTLPTTGEQARHALLLLGAPAALRMVAEVHAALILRVAEFTAMRPSAGRHARRLLRELAQRVPHGVEAVDLAEAARAALADPALAAGVGAEEPRRQEAAGRAAALDLRHQLFGRPAVPHQRDGG